MARGPRTAVAAGAAAVAVLLWGLYPGYASFDTLSQLAQARSGVLDDVAAPAMALLFQATAGGFQDTGFALLCGALATLAATFAVLRRCRVPGWAVAIAVAALVPLWLLLPHAWSDIHLLACLATATALAAASRRDPDGALAWPAWVLLFALLGWATWVRHNAILAVLPLALLLLPAATARRRWGAAGLLVLALLGVRALSGVAVDQPRSVWAVAPLWDLQALSLARGEVLLPPGMVGPGMDVAQLRAAFSPYSAVPLFAGTRSGVRNPTIERLDPGLARALRRAWVAAVAASPADWLRHRATVVRGLLGTHRAGELADMVDVPRFPPAARRTPGQERVHALWRLGAESAKAVGLASPAWPLLAGALLLVLGWRRRRGIDPLAALLAASALLYAGALAVVAPSAELRYLAWPMWAWCMAGCLALGGPRAGAAGTGRDQPPAAARTVAGSGMLRPLPGSIQTSTLLPSA